MLGIGSPGVLATYANKTKPKPTIFAIDDSDGEKKTTNNECAPMKRGPARADDSYTNRFVVPQQYSNKRITTIRDPNSIICRYLIQYNVGIIIHNLTIRSVKRLSEKVFYKRKAGQFN